MRSDTDAIDARLEWIAPGLYRFDTGYIRPRHTACFIVAAEGRAAIVDCAVAATIEPLLAAVDSLGIDRGAIDRVVVTHAHLDHAGGAGQLMVALPRATLYAHPSAARHLIDPSRLEQGTRAVYGDAFFEREYGALLPVAAERVVETPDDAVVHVGERALRVLHTPGHAWHHQSLWDAQTATVIAGDAFGVGYPELDSPGDPESRFFVPETPPNQFDPEAMHASIDRILALDPARVEPTHFGTLNDPPAIAAQLHDLVDEYIARCLWAVSLEDLEHGVMHIYEQTLERRGGGEYLERMREVYAMDAGLVAQGLWHWRGKRTVG